MKNTRNEIVGLCLEVLAVTAYIGVTFAATLLLMR